MNVNRTGAGSVLLGEPERTQVDLNFSFFGIPVRVHPFFWVIGVLLGPINTGLVEVLVRVAAFFVAILVHELGHALAMRAYGFRPWITLYGLGGLTSYDPAGTYGSKGSGPLRQIVISAAGPGAGFVLAGILLGLIVATGYRVQLRLGGTYGVLIGMEQVGPEYLTAFLWYLLFISIVWGIVNLLPVYPLDGGQIAREVFLAANPRDGIRQSLLLSVWTAAGVAVAVLVRSIQASGGRFDLGMLWAPALFGYLAYASYATLQAYTNHRGW
jgi:stage IV sporulation protein FB